MLNVLIKDVFLFFLYLGLYYQSVYSLQGVGTQGRVFFSGVFKRSGDLTTVVFETINNKQAM